MVKTQEGTTFYVMMRNNGKFRVKTSEGEEIVLTPTELEKFRKKNNELSTNEFLEKHGPVQSTGYEPKVPGKLLKTFELAIEALLARMDTMQAEIEGLKASRRAG